jgi:hypothetical protein
MTTVKMTVWVLVCILVAEQAAWALDSKNVAYFGGTLPGFEAIKDPVEGQLDTTSPDALVFVPKERKQSGLHFAVPYAQIEDLEYGQKAGRRVGAAVTTTVLLGPIGLLSLFSKKRKHYLTIGFKDQAGKDQVAVLELGKDMVRTTLAIVPTRSGKEIEYQDDEARKSAK